MEADSGWARELNAIRLQLGLEEADLALMRDRIMAWYGEGQHLEAAALSDHLCTMGLSGLVEELSHPCAALPSGVGSVDRSSRALAWRERASRLRRSAERRALGDAVAEAILGAGEDEQRARMLALRRLLDAGGPAREPGEDHGT